MSSNRGRELEGGLRPRRDIANSNHSISSNYSHQKTKDYARASQILNLKSSQEAISNYKLNPDVLNTQYQRDAYNNQSTVSLI